MLTEVAIFTEAIARELQERGFELVRIGGRNENIYYFQESVSLWAAVDELLEAYANESI